MKPRLFFIAAGAFAAAVPVALALFAFSPAEAQSSDATLSALTVSPGTITDFASDRTDYVVAVEDSVSRVTINVATTDEDASISYDPPDADTEATGHQVDLGRRAQTVTITVTSENTVVRRMYTVTIGWSSSEAYGWKVTDDLDGLRAAENRQPWGIWGNDTTFWIADYFDHKLYAYNRDGSRDGEKDIALDAQNRDASGIWSNGQTAWVADGQDQKLYAYTLENGVRQQDRDVILDTLGGQSEPSGIWSDGRTIWVAEYRVMKLIAYRLADGTRDEPQDFDLGSDYGAAKSMWSDGVEMWVAFADETVRAFDMESKTVIPGRVFDTLPAFDFNYLADIWSDGDTMWVVHGHVARVLSYNMPLSDNADLRSLSVDGAEVPGFDPATTVYTVRESLPVRQVTVSAQPRQPKAAVAGIEPPDADIDTDGHQVEIDDGDVPIAVTVTAQDGTTKTYTVNVRSPVCNESLGWGRVIADNGACVLLRFLIVKVADGHTVGYAADELGKLPGWKARCRMYMLRMLCAEHTPDNLTLAQLKAERDKIAAYPWAKYAEVDSLVYIGSSAPGGGQLIPANSEPTGAPSISGTAQVGATLSVSTEGISDPDGLEHANFAYQWIVADGNTEADISGATSSTLTLGSAQARKNVRVLVSFTDDAGNTETLTSPDVYVLPPPLTAALQNLPESHDGENTFVMRVAFNQGIAISWKDFRDHSFAVTGGDVTHSRRVDRRNDLWEITVEPEGNDDVVVSLTSERGCAVRGAPCNADGMPLTNQPEATIPGPPAASEETTPENTPAAGAPAISGTAQVGETLTASTSAITDGDGLENATFTFQWVAVDGETEADISGAIGSTHTLTDVQAGKSVRVRVNFTDDAGNAETLSSSSVSVQPPPLTVEFLEFPTSHDGTATFTFELRFSEEFPLSYVTLRDHAFTVSGGEVTKARRLARPSNVRWEITVEPHADADVAVVLSATSNCEEQGAICAEDGRKLSNQSALTVAGQDQ